MVLIAVLSCPRFAAGTSSRTGSLSQNRPPTLRYLKREQRPPIRLVLQGNGFAGGPRQISLELKAWNSSVRPSALPLSKAGGAFNRLKGSKSTPSRLPAPVEPQREEAAPVAEPFFESVGPGLTDVEPHT